MRSRIALANAAAPAMVVPTSVQLGVTPFAVVKLRVAQFLANLWQEEPMARAPTPSSRQPSTTSDRHRWCSAVLRRLRVERGANGEASSVMATGSDRWLMAKKYGRLCPSERVAKGLQSME
jgi:DNA-directed RNA polymerase beta subunit